MLANGEQRESAGARPVLGWLLALVLPSVATVLKVWLARYLEPTYILFYPAVAVAAIVGGLWPGMLATVVAALLAWYWVLPPPGVFHALSAQEAAGTVAFVGMGVLVSALAESLQRARRRAAVRHRDAALLSASLDGIWVVDATGRIRDVNPVICEMTGYAREELLARRVGEIRVDAYPGQAAEQLARIRDRGSDRFEARLRRKDGRVIEVEAQARVLDAASGEVVSFVRDMTEQRAMREKLAVAQRLAAMGTLVAGLAHEINNPLGGALASHGFAVEELDGLRALLRGGGPVDRERLGAQLDAMAEALVDAQDGEERVARIVRDLVLLGRPGAGRERIGLKDLVTQAVGWIPPSLSARATVEIEAGDAPEVLAASGQVGQVVLNLVSNALRAIPEGTRGRITVRIGRGGRGWARLEVSDDGVGMTPEVMDRMFDPFFTTRPAGQGMGLGLPICHAIVTAHGGTLTATSEPGKGSSFVVEFPPADAVEAGSEAGPRAAAPA